MELLRFWSDRADEPRRKPGKSKLTRRILAINAIALATLVGGVFYLDQFRQGLIDARIQNLRIEGEIIAGALSEAATSGPEARALEVRPASQILARLVVPAEIRARLFAVNGRMLVDSRDLAVGNLIVTKKLPPVGTWEALWKKIANTFHKGVDALAAKEDLPPYTEELNQRAEQYPEVMAALGGDADVMMRVTEQGVTIITVAVPVQRLRRVLGGLLLSKDTADIDRMVRKERVEILKIFGISLGVTLLLSTFLASTIARPIRLLAEAADRVRPGRGRNVEIPDFTHRKDEIGELSHALHDMTQALFRQLDAVEAFAADVSHEIKNPLTSLRSALETLGRTKDPVNQQKLMAIMESDVERLNRLITDISAASRLDAQMSRAHMEPVDLVALLKDMVEVYQATAKPGTPPLTLVLPSEPRLKVVRVLGIDSALGQVIRNLVDNAFSFSPPGRPVTVTLRRRGPEVEISVEDEGPGIRPDKLTDIFDRFYSERPSGESFGKHSGLGLAICKRIVEAHGGEIFAENRRPQPSAPGAFGDNGGDGNGSDAPGGGARFVVRLPFI